MDEFLNKTRFVLRHPIDFIDPHCYEYKICDAETGEVLLESYEKNKKLVKLKDFTCALLNIEISAGNSGEFVKIEQELIREL